MSDEEATRAGWSTPSGPQQPSYGQGPSYPQQPAYGQPPAYGYGQQPTPGHAAGPVPDPDRRPVTVTVAAWLGIVFSAGWGLLSLFFVVFALAGYDNFLDEAADSSNATAGFVILVFLLSIAVGGAGVLGGVLVLRRSNAGRILLTVLASLAAFVWLVSIVAIFPVVPLLAAVATVILLFVGGANDWFAHRTPLSPGGGQAPGPYGGAPYGGAPYGGAPKGW